MEPMQIVVLVLIFVAILCAVFGVWLLVGGGSKGRIRLRMDGVQQIKDFELGESIAVAHREKERKRQQKKDFIKKEVFSDIPALDARLKASSWAENLYSRLRQAQLPLTVSQFLLISCGGAGLGASVAFIWRRGFDPLLFPLFAVLLGIAPYVYVAMVVRRRIKRFGLQFPDALDMLSSCVQGGLSLNSAVQNIAAEMPEPVSDEFRIFSDELAFGVDLSVALTHFSERVDTADVKFFCAALMIQKETGGNLGEVLDSLQKTIRERFRILGQLKTLTAQGRLSGWIVGALPLALGGVIYLANPEYMSSLITTTMGHKLLAVAGALQLMGFVIIRKIVDIKV